MTRNAYDLTVFVGRFSPFHKGHEKVVHEAFNNSDFVMIMPGSDNRPTTSRNPYTTAERVEMIRAAMTPTRGDYRLLIEPIEDTTYNDHLWMAQVQAKVDHHFKHGKGTSAKTPTIALIGFEKDESSYYVNMFPQWDNISVDPYVAAIDEDIEAILNASDIRKALYANGGVIPSFLNDPAVLSPAVFDILKAHDHSLAAKEYRLETDYKKQFHHPYGEVMHNTVDAVIVQSGHVLVGRRSALPGRGLNCLPGGFLQHTETLIAGMIRELREETKLKVPDPVLRGNIKSMQIFDDPHRSTRGRIITAAYLIELPNGPLPKVKAADDMMKKSVRWMPLSEVRSNDFFEDHYDIIQVMSGNRKRSTW